MMAKIHTIKDESLGGVLREYVEVERKADVGDYVICTGDCPQGRFYKRGDIGKYLYDNEEYPSVRVKFDEDLGGLRENGECYVGREKYRTLAPTDIVIVDGKRYRMVERKAEVGEKVLTVKYGGEKTKKGDVLTCTRNDEYNDNSIDAKKNITDDHYAFFDVDYDKYLVLEPVAADNPTVDTRHASPEIIDLLANLARRVTSLEQQLRDTQGNVERLAEELTTKTHEQSELIEMALDDIVTLDARTHGVPKLEKRVDHIITYDLGWKRMGPGRIPNIEIKVSAIKSEVNDLADKLADLLEEIAGGARR